MRRYNAPMQALNRAGCSVQLLTLTPGLGSSFLAFLSLTGRRSPRPTQSRRPLFRLTDHPFLGTVAARRSHRPTRSALNRQDFGMASQELGTYE